ncbi:MAG: DNA internalization-related competence protein ComEC/Rec2 [Nitrospirae bacterium]|nr:MAG: DNA internalization-related competence protein ComEC/Rec2 [Nitrospirota bacterium]
MILPPVLSVLAGLLAGSFLPYLPCSISLLVFLFGIVLAWQERSGHVSVSKGLVLFGSFVFGIVWWNAAGWWSGHHDLTRWLDRPTVQVRGTVAEEVHRTPDRLAVIVQLSQVREASGWEPASGRLLITWRAPDHRLYPGDTIETSVHMRPPYGTRNPGGFDYAAYLAREGVHAVASLWDAEHLRLREQPPSLRYWVSRTIARWRGAVNEAATNSLNGPALSIFLAVIIGEQGLLSPDERDVFTATGTAHIMAISGTHLGILAGLMFFLVRDGVRRLPSAWLERLALRITPTRLAVLATVPVVVLYALLAGAKIATVRALVMILFAMTAVWLGRERQLLTVLAIAACLLLLYHPSSLYDASFQLSFVSVYAIALMLRWQNWAGTDDGSMNTEAAPRHWQRWGSRFRQIVLVSLVVTTATLPLVAYHFNQLAWIGPFTNVVVVPFVGFLVIPIGLMSAFWVIGSDMDTLPFATILQRLLDAVFHGLRLLSEVIPGTEWHVASPAFLSILVFYVLMVLATRPEGSRWWRVASVGGILILTVWWAWSPKLGWDEDSLRVAFLDIGQGDAAVIELPDGQVVVIDGGPTYTRLDMGRAVIGPYLWDRGIRRIDHIIATHPQWDHMGGLAWVVRHFDVGQFWSNGIERSNPFYLRVKQAVRESGVGETRAWAGQIITRAGPCRLMVLNPPLFPDTRTVLSAISQNGSLLNNHSIVTQLDCGLHSFLFTADAEREALRRLSRMPENHRARVVKVPHHGAKSSLEREWINGLNAEIAVITVGRRNRYGHPDRSVVDAYVQHGIQVYRTDRDGAVWITAKLDDPRYRVQTARDQMVQPVWLGRSIIDIEIKNWSRLWRQWSGEV